jgi:membrane-associated phospholipid phosphatase
MTENEKDPGWARQMAVRFKRLWLIKLVGSSVAMTVFMIGYFTLLRHAAFPVTLIPLTRIDDWVPYQPWWIIPYASLWLYISLVPNQLYSGRELLTYLKAVVTMAAFGFAIFFFWPTAVPKVYFDWSQHPGIAFLKSIDASGNACPSLHVAYAVFSCLCLHGLLGEMRAPRLLRVLNVLWCLAIAYSTLATKQHVVIDLLAGSLIGLVAGALYLVQRRGARLPLSTPAAD